MNNKDEYIDSAATKFKQISSPDKYHYRQKFRSLPYWLIECSKYFMFEANNQLLRNYAYYKRGAVINVNFGVNEGSEFSNLHFAVVLDKRDSPKKRTLTVIPLTSKSKPGRFYLGKEIFNQTASILLVNLKQLKEKINILGEDNKKLGLKLQNLEKESIQVKKEADDINNEIDAIIKNRRQISTTNYTNDEMKAISILYNKLIEKQTEIQSISLKIDNIDEEGKIIDDKITECATKQKQLERIIQIYKKYNKNTFARIEDITTISKLRIHKINDFDPSGKIRLSSEQMKSISNKLMQLYIS